MPTKAARRARRPAKSRACIKRRGENYVVHWKEPDGRPRSRTAGTGAHGRSVAGKLLRMVEEGLAAGGVPFSDTKTWDHFVANYKARILSARPAASRRKAEHALELFEQLAKPGRVNDIDAKTIEAFVAERRKQTYQGRPISATTLNTEIRAIEAALKVAREWGYCYGWMPKVRRERNLRTPIYVLPQHFDAIFEACSVARFPESGAAEWWRALLTLMYTAGLRIDEALALTRADVDLELGIARLSAGPTKRLWGGDAKLHAALIAVLTELPGASERLFDWPHDEKRMLFAIRKEICKAAGVPAYTFPDFTRAFELLNAKRTPSEVWNCKTVYGAGEPKRGFYEVFVPKAVRGLALVFLDPSEWPIPR